MIDTSTWRGRTIDAGATYAVLAAGKLLVYGGESEGLALYRTDGRRISRLFSDATIRRVHLDGERAYVRAGEGYRVVDLALGSVLREVTTSVRLVEIVETAP